ncbi:hypothetical protein R6Q59_030062 [Mikania micrantha]
MSVLAPPSLSSSLPPPSTTSPPPHSHTYINMSVAATPRPPPPARHLPQPSTPPRLIPERGQVLRNVLRSVFSCFYFAGERHAKRQRRSSVSPI